MDITSRNEKCKAQSDSPVKKENKTLVKNLMQQFCNITIIISIEN